jgi:Rrf2 family protein
MKLSRTVSYAVQATLQLAQAEPGATVPCSQLAAEGQMPERFLLQVLRSLVMHGILQSTRGVDGGYTLERNADEISLLDLIEAIEGPLVTETPISETWPVDAHQRLQDALQEVTESTRRELAAIKLSHLIPQPPRPESSAK